MKSPKKQTTPMKESAYGSATGNSTRAEDLEHDFQQASQIEGLRLQNPLQQFDPYGLHALGVTHSRPRTPDVVVDDAIGCECRSTAKDAAVAAALQVQLQREVQDQEAENLRKSISLAREMEDEFESTIATLGVHDEIVAMKSTAHGKAWVFVERVLLLMEAIEQESHQNDVNHDDTALQFCPVATDDMVFLAERMFDFQDCFRQSQKPTHVDIGYHFTNASSLERIKSDGLLSKAERSITGIESRNNGSKYGDGIYTSSTPYAYQNFGDIGILCARLKGESVAVERGQSFTKDTGVARGGTDKESAILGSCRQCLPLVYFRSSSFREGQKYMLSTRKAVERVYDFQERLQRLLDEFLNDGDLTPVRRLLPDNSQGPSSQVRNSTSTAAVAEKRTILPSMVVANVLLTYIAPENLFVDLPLSFEVEGSWLTCSLCRGTCVGPILCLDACGHTFHRRCIEQSGRFGYKCPDCGAILGKPQGVMPTATMEVNVVTDDCNGFPGDGSIVINYLVPSGVQQSYHPVPGLHYAATRRRAFLPNITEGLMLTRRLEYAFQCGLTFKVGKSLTSGKDNVVTWGTIPHKSTRNYGPFGYPDNGYIRKCNEELDSLGVPDARSCQL